MVQAETSAAKQALRLQGAARATQTGSWRLRLDTGLLTWSDGMYRVFGIERDAFRGDLGEVVGRVMHPDDQVTVTHVNGAVIEDGIPRPVDYRILLPDGLIRWVHAELTRETDEEGRVVALFGFVQDITEPRAAFEELQEAEAIFRATFEQSAVGMAHIGLDGSWLRVNQRMCDILGYTRDELIGLEFADITHPDDVEDGLERLRRLQEGAEDTYAVEKRYIRKDGSPVWVRLNVGLVRDGGGKPLYQVSVTEDITERRDAQAALEASELRFSTVFHTSPDAICINRLSDGLFIDANEGFTAFLGLAADDVKGRTSADVDVWGDPADRARLIGKLRDAGEAHGFEALFRRKDGTLIPTLMSARVVGINGEQCILSVTKDITERKAAEEHIRKLNRVYAILGAINRAIVHMRQPQELLDEACRIIVGVGGLRAAWVGLVNPGGEHVRVVAQAGATEGYLDEVGIVLGDEQYGKEPTGLCISERRHVTSQDIDRDPAMAPWRENALRYGYRSSASFPLIVMDKAVGAICMFANEPDFFDEGQLELLDELAGDVSFAMEFAEVEDERRQAEMEIKQHEARLEELLEERERNLELLGRSLSSIIEVVTQVVEIRDPYTAGHQRRVAELATRISEEMGMSSQEIDEIRIAALIHDVGKMLVPAEILSKPGRLSREEFALIKLHADAGYRIIASASMEGQIAQIVYQHHERCDGSGYPRGLSADELLPAAKVLMVSDVVEAMTSHRPYRPALGIDMALAEIERGAGSLYDAEVCQACMTVFRVRGFAFSEEWGEETPQPPESHGHAQSAK